MSTSISDKIRQARTLAGLTQSELAKQIGVSQKTISRLEGGRDERLNAIFPILESIAKVTGVSFQQLIGCYFNPATNDVLKSTKLPKGLRDLLNDNALRESLNITDDEIANLATITLDAPVTKSGYTQLLIAIRAITGK